MQNWDKNRAVQRQQIYKEGSLFTGRNRKTPEKETILGKEGSFHEIRLGAWLDICLWVFITIIFFQVNKKVIWYEAPAQRTVRLKIFCRIFFYPNGRDLVP